MFTIEQIKSAHSKVKSGADFPAYIQDMKNLGILAYEHLVSDGSIHYSGANNFHLAAAAKWELKAIAQTGSAEQLKHSLHIHQNGQTTYPVFCQQAADAGVEKWIVDMQAMTCTYYDQAGNSMLKEAIPEVN